MRGLVAGIPLAVRGDVVSVGEPIRQVLNERTPTDDVERLGPAADGEDRHVALVGRAGDRELEAVEVGLGRAEVLVRLLAVGIRVQVRPAGEADAGDPVEQGLDQVHPQRRDHDRHASGRLDRSQVGEPERHLVAWRLPLGRRLDRLGTPHLRCRHADQRLRPGAARSSSSVSPIKEPTCPSRLLRARC